jgi:hypothetical protein
LAAALPAQTGTFEIDRNCIDQICFVDRSMGGQIPLGRAASGISVIDFDRDGWPDLIVGALQGRPNRLLRNAPDPLRPGQRTYVDATAGSGLDDADGTARQSLSVLVADTDNDGDHDVFVLGQSLGAGLTSGVLYRNEGNGTFTNISAASGVRTGPDYIVSASFNDYDHDGLVDLLICSWFTAPTNTRLLRNLGNNTFQNVSHLLPQIPTYRVAYGHVWMDYDGDGWADCFIIADRLRGVLLKNVDDGQGGRRFVDSAIIDGFIDVGDAPMGIAAGDWDNDGDFDIALSDKGAGRYFENRAGKMVQVFPMTALWGWGTDFLDADNDGWLDFYMAIGWDVLSAPDMLWRNLGGGRFADITPALNALPVQSRESLQLDFDNDGRLDLVVANPETTASLYHNRSFSRGHWTMLDVRGDGVAVNRDAIGAVVRLTAGGQTQIRQIVSGSSTSSTQDLRAHFGLGDANVIDRIEIVWPRRGDLASRTEVFPGPFGADRLIALQPRCAGPAADLGQGKLGGNGLVPRIAMCGQLGAGKSAQFALRDGPPSAPAAVLLAGSANPIALLGGTIVPDLANYAHPCTTDATGAFAFDVPGRAEAIVGYVQVVLADPRASFGVGISNALQVHWGR